jgi:hypothetical protein
VSVIQNKSENEKKKKKKKKKNIGSSYYFTSLKLTSKVCEAPVGKDLQIFSTGWCREL